MAELNPLIIILVENGSKGERLLFRYPYMDLPEHVRSKSIGGNPYCVPVPEDLFASRHSRSSNISHHRLVGFSDKLLSNLCTVQSRQTGRRFEVKVNDVRFVGHPLAVRHGHGRSFGEADKSTIHLFHIVFALWAKADTSVVDCYHDLSRRLAIAVNHEERRCRYLTIQARTMIGIHDDYSSQPESHQFESPFGHVISVSQLARELKAVYDGLIQTGSVQVSIGGWIDVSFALPHKLHKLKRDDAIMQPNEIRQCLSLLRPYHTLLLLEADQELLRSLSPDSSPALRRLIRANSPLLNLQQLAADADLTLRHVFQLVGQLVYWAKATIMYPLCEKNVYVISPWASIKLPSMLSNDFAERFQGTCLHSVMSEFSQPSTVMQNIHPVNSSFMQCSKIEMLIWLLQRQLLVQLHMYVFFTPNRKPPQVTAELLQFTSQCSSDVDTAAATAVSERTVLSELPESDRLAVLNVPASKNPDKLALFSRLLPYFDGEHHLEEMMHCENVKRSQIHRLLEEFSDVLNTCQTYDQISHTS